MHFLLTGGCALAAGVAMGRGGHAGCNRTRVAWAGGGVLFFCSAYVLAAVVEKMLVIVLYAMLAMFAYGKREWLSSYCRPAGTTPSPPSVPRAALAEPQAARPARALPLTAPSPPRFGRCRRG